MEVKTGLNTEIQRLSNGRFAPGFLIRNIGRPLVWETPSAMLSSFEDYISWCEDNPCEVIEYNGKDAIQCVLPKQRITTILGFCRFCGTMPNIFDVYSKKDVFKEVVSYVRAYMSGLNVEGAGAGLINFNIVSRIEGLVDKKQVDTNLTQKVVFYQPTIDAPIQAQIEEGDSDLVEDAEMWDL